MELSTSTRDLRDEERNIRVLLRVRPPLQRELDFGFRQALDQGPDPSLVSIAVGNAKPQLFQFDDVGWANFSQRDMFEKVGKPITEKCVRGYNGTIFAYGQTGSGKTFTIQGASDGPTQVSHEFRNLVSDPQGLMPRVFEYLFQLITSTEAASGNTVKYLCQASFLEIYNDRIYDLLVADSDVMPIRENPDHSVYVDGLQEVAINCSEDALRVMVVGCANRTVGETVMNRESSRSHSVFSLTVSFSTTDRETGITTVTSSRFNLVDLAGSERQSSSGAAGARLTEAANINQSLSALGNVIISLVDVSLGKKRHVPYRDSKLTFFLRDSLGGNSLTYLVACVSPSSESALETLSTLNFAQRAKRVRNHGAINTDVSGSMDALKKENLRLREALRALTIMQSGGSPGVSMASSMLSRLSSSSSVPWMALDGDSDSAAAVCPNCKSPQSLQPHAQPGASPVSTRDQMDVVTFDVDLFRQSLAREKLLREEFDRAQEELERTKELNNRLNKEKQSVRMILNFREQSLRQLQEDVAKLRKKETSAQSALEKAMSIEVARLREELQQVTDQLTHSPDLLAKSMRIRSLELQVSDLNCDIEELEELHADSKVAERSPPTSRSSTTCVPAASSAATIPLAAARLAATPRTTPRTATQSSSSAASVHSTPRSVPVPVTSASITASASSPSPAVLPSAHAPAPAPAPAASPTLNVVNTSSSLLHSKIDEIKVPYLLQRTSIWRHLMELQQFNFQLSEELAELKFSGLGSADDVRQREAAFAADKKVLEEKLLAAESALTEEKQRCTTLMKERNPIKIVAIDASAELEKQLEESRNLAKSLKAFLEKAVQREQDAKAKVAELEEAVEQTLEAHIEEVSELKSRESENIETLHTLSNLIMRQEKENLMFKRLLDKERRAAHAALDDSASNQSSSLREGSHGLQQRSLSSRSTVAMNLKEKISRLIDSQVTPRDDSSRGGSETSDPAEELDSASAFAYRNGHARDSQRDAYDDVDVSDAEDPPPFHSTYTYTAPRDRDHDSASGSSRNLRQRELLSVLMEKQARATQHAPTRGPEGVAADVGNPSPVPFPTAPSLLKTSSSASSSSSSSSSSGIPSMTQLRNAASSSSSPQLRSDSNQPHPSADASAIAPPPPPYSPASPQKVDVDVSGTTSGSAERVQPVRTSTTSRSSSMSSSTTLSSSVRPLRSSSLGTSSLPPSQSFHHSRKGSLLRPPSTLSSDVAEAIEFVVDNFNLTGTRSNPPSLTSATQRASEAVVTAASPPVPLVRASTLPEIPQASPPPPVRLVRASTLPEIPQATSTSAPVTPSRRCSLRAPRVSTCED